MAGTGKLKFPDDRPQRTDQLKQEWVPEIHVRRSDTVQMGGSQGRRTEPLRRVRITVTASSADLAHPDSKRRRRRPSRSREPASSTSCCPSARRRNRRPRITTASLMTHPRPCPARARSRLDALAVGHVIFCLSGSRIFKAVYHSCIVCIELAIGISRIGWPALTRRRAS
jgi:hypothetical protein